MKSKRVHRISRLPGILSVTLALVVPAGAQDFLNGLVSYYPFTGSANDAVGTNNGIVYGAMLSTNRAGTANSAYLFNGSAYIDYGAPANLMFSNDFTVTVWFSFSGGAAYNPRIVSFAGGGYEIFTGGLGANREFEVASGGSLIHTTQAYPQDTWTALAYVFQNGIGSIYVNGALVVTNAMAPPTFPYGLHIGNNSDDAEDGFGGLITNVRFYNRALPGFEVQELYLYESQPVLCSPHRAAATAQLTNGVLAGVTITDSGCGYTNAPEVLMLGGSGAGATATATVYDGLVVAVNITSGGTGYTNTPTVYFYSPFGVQIGLVQAVAPSISDLLVGTNYQLQTSTDMVTWMNQGAVFTATDPAMIYPQYFNVSNWNALFFRVQVVP